jgi:curved DNA-binding protein CbpA
MCKHNERDMKTHYDILGIQSTATQDEIKKAFRNISKIKHPDLGGSHDEFILITKAYEILSDPAKKAAYDLSNAETADHKSMTTNTTSVANHSFLSKQPNIDIIKNLWREGNNNILWNLAQDAVSPHAQLVFLRMKECFTQDRLDITICLKHKSNLNIDASYSEGDTFNTHAGGIGSRLSADKLSMSVGYGPRGSTTHGFYLSTESSIFNIRMFDLACKSLEQLETKLKERMLEIKTAIACFFKKGIHIMDKKYPCTSWLPNQDDVFENLLVAGEVICDSNLYQPKNKLVTLTNGK